MKMVCATCARSYHIPQGTPGAAHDFQCRACGGAGVASSRLPPVLAVTQERRARPVSRASGTSSRGRGRFAALCAPLAAAALVGLTMGAVAMRARVVALFPPAEAAYAAIGLPVNTRGLAIEDVRAQMALVGDKKVLMVEGSIVNLRAGDTLSPDIRISLRGADGRELYVWTSRGPERRLGHSERARFAARLEAPPDGIRDAMVKFVAAGNVARDAEGS